MRLFTFLLTIFTSQKHNKTQSNSLNEDNHVQDSSRFILILPKIPQLEETRRRRRQHGTNLNTTLPTQQHHNHKKKEITIIKATYPFDNRVIFLLFSFLQARRDAIRLATWTHPYRLSRLGQAESSVPD